MKRIKSVLGQSTIEFTFGMIVIVFLIYGMVRVFRWAGLDLAQGRYVQDKSLTQLSSRDAGSALNYDLDNIQPIAAVYHGTVSNGNISQ